MRTQNVRRDTLNGRFVSSQETHHRPRTTTVETVTIKKKGGWKKH